MVVRSEVVRGQWYHLDGSSGHGAQKRVQRGSLPDDLPPGPGALAATRRVDTAATVSTTSRNLVDTVAAFDRSRTWV
jgi:hypothetical protein